METEEIISRVFGFRTHPFCPSVDSNGDALSDPFAQALRPDEDPRHLHYYFDLYDWFASVHLGSVELAQLLQKFPAKQGLNAESSPLTLIAGPQDSGRESVHNFLLHAIKSQNSAPLVVDYVVEGSDRSETVKDIARFFMMTYAESYPNPTEDQMQKDLSTMTTADVASRSSFYVNLFRYWRLKAARSCNRPIVLNVRGRTDYDMWRVIYNSTRELFSFVFVVTGDLASAKTCRQVMEGENVHLISARLLDEEEALDYVEQRLQSERLSNSDSLEPFTRSAISALYRPGPTASEHVRFRIGYLHRALKEAFDFHIRDLASAVDARGGQLSLTQGERDMAAATMQRAYESLNLRR